jgi:two-component system response regulator YesN
MKTVFIVEDESRIAALIKTLIHWDDLDLALAGTFSNGKDALTAAIALPPDIIISDIKMPIMDGLELIKKMSEAGLKSQVVLVSGFREFEYARAAITYGVEEYLLKPIKEKNINSVLSKITLTLSEKENESEAVKVITRELERSKPALIREAINVLETGNFQGNIIDFNRRYGTQFTEDLFTVFIIKYDPCEYNLEEKAKYKPMLDNILEYTTARFNNNGPCFLAAINDDMLIINAVLNLNSGKAYDVESLLWSVLDAMKVSLFQGDDITAAFSEECKFTGLQAAFKNVSSALDVRLLRGTGKVLYADKSIAGAVFPNITDFSAAARAAITLDTDAVIVFIDRLFVNLKKESANGQWVIMASRELIETVFNSVPQTTEIENIKKRLHSEILHVSSVTKLKKLLKKRIVEFLEIGKAVLESRSSKPIRAALQYIEDHYNEKVTLEDVADISGFNPTYFSVLFKKETGRNFSAALLEKRMDKAKEFLRTSRDTIECVSEKTGFTDTRYFSETFTKMVGMKPSLYRRLYS